ncbi:MAG TPA: hypothetical protein VNL38_01010, partial [Candidatus Nitrosotenuis sp.]|nr:hypothetical protein [Candidatus Nitrosotenuis sp.]
FSFSPFYNQGREYSAADFITGDKGFSTALNLFSGGNTPLFLNYMRSSTRSGLYGVAGAEANVLGAGSSENLSANWFLRLPRWPSLQLGYFRNRGDYRVFGTNASFGRSRTSGYVLGAQYNLLGFALTASLNRQKFRQQLPQVLAAGGLQTLTTTDQRNLQFAAHRRITRASFFDLGVTRSRWSTDMLGQPQRRRYDTLLTGITARPREPLTVGFRFHYTSDLNALLLGSVLPGGSAPSGFPVDPLRTNTRYVLYNAYAGYSGRGGLQLRTGLRHGRARLSNLPGSSDTTFDSSLSVVRTFGGTRLTAGYTATLYDYQSGTAQTSSQGHTGSLNLSRVMRGWNYSALLQYSTTSIEAMLPGNTHNLTTEFSTNGMLRSWRLTTSYRFERFDSVFHTSSDNRRHAFRLALARHPWDFAFTGQFGNGLSILTVAGPRSATLPQVAAAAGTFERLLIPSESSSFSFQASYQFARRSTLHGGLTRFRYLSLQEGVERSNRLDQFDVHVRHWYRLLELRAGYRRYAQKFSGANGQYTADTFYFQVSRHFNVF